MMSPLRSCYDNTDRNSQVDSTTMQHPICSGSSLLPSTSKALPSNNNAGEVSTTDETGCSRDEVKVFTYEDEVDVEADDLDSPKRHPLHGHATNSNTALDEEKKELVTAVEGRGKCEPIPSTSSNITGTSSANTTQTPGNSAFAQHTIATMLSPSTSHQSPTPVHPWAAAFAYPSAFFAYPTAIPFWGNAGFAMPPGAAVAQLFAAFQQQQPQNNAGRPQFPSSTPVPPTAPFAAHGQPPSTPQQFNPMSAESLAAVWPNMYAMSLNRFPSNQTASNQPSTPGTSQASNGLSPMPSPGGGTQIAPSSYANGTSALAAAASMFPSQVKLHATLPFSNPFAAVAQSNNHPLFMSNGAGPVKRENGHKTSKKNRMNHIKKPLNAFMLYMKEQRPIIMRESNLMERQSAEINRILGRRWHDLTKDQQQKYYEMAQKVRQEHMAMYPHWSARDNYAMHKTKKKKRDKQHSNLEQKKCRARFGVDQQDKWCKHCKRKKRCLLYREADTTSDQQPSSSSTTDSMQGGNPSVSMHNGVFASPATATSGTTSDTDDDDDDDLSSSLMLNDCDLDDLDDDGVDVASGPHSPIGGVGSPTDREDMDCLVNGLDHNDSPSAAQVSSTTTDHPSDHPPTPTATAPPSCVPLFPSATVKVESPLPKETAVVSTTSSPTSTVHLLTRA